MKSVFVISTYLMLAGLLGLASSCRPRANLATTNSRPMPTLAEARHAKDMHELDRQIEVADLELAGMDEAARAKAAVGLVNILPASKTARLVVKLNDPEFNLWQADKLALVRHPVLDRIISHYHGKLLKAVPALNMVVFEFANHEKATSARDRMIGAKVFLANSVVIDEAHGDAVISINSVPSDIEFKKQWGLNNTGIDYQADPAGVPGGVAGVDIGAVKAWDTQSDSSGVVVGLTDTGIQLDHPDLAANIWKNPGETGTDAQGKNKSTNLIDDDGNGYVDDVNGWDCLNDDNNPTDDHGHGTQTAGVVGAVGNNSIGVSGVARNVKLAGLKFLGADGMGSGSDAAECILYAVTNKMNIINASWAGGPSLDIDIKPVIEMAASSGILFVAAAGNLAKDIGLPGNETSPAGFVYPNLITVGSINRSAGLSYFSNFNKSLVHVMAPGEQIHTTGVTDTYDAASGTSFSAPMVSGMAALMKARFAKTDPEKTTPEKIKENLLATSVLTTALATSSQSKGYVSLSKALAYDPPLTATPTSQQTSAGVLNSCPAEVALKGPNFIARLMLPAAACLTGMTAVTSYEKYTVNRQCCAATKAPVCVNGAVTWSRWLIYDAYRRAANVSEAENLGGKIVAKTTTATAAANTAFTSDATYTLNVNTAYQSLFKRTTPAASLAGWVTMLRSGKGSVYLMSQIMLTQAYYNLGGGTAAKWVPFIYLNVLGRAGTSAEITAGVKALSQGKARNTVALTLLNTTEYRTKFVINPTYQLMYRRAPTAAELSARRSEMVAGKTPEAIRLALAVAPTYYQVKSICPGP